MVLTSDVFLQLKLLFVVLAGLNLLAIAYLGGITSVSGAVVGGTLAAGGVSFYVLQQYVGVSTEFTFLVGGVGLIITAVLNPEGIAGATRKTSQQLRGRLAFSKPVVVAPAAVKGETA